MGLGTDIFQPPSEASLFCVVSTLTAAAGCKRAVGTFLGWPFAANVRATPPLIDPTHCMPAVVLPPTAKPALLSNCEAAVGYSSGPGLTAMVAVCSAVASESAGLLPEKLARLNGDLKEGGLFDRKLLNLRGSGSMRKWTLMSHASSTMNDREFAS